MSVKTAAVSFASRKTANRYLHGHWKTALLVQIFPLLWELCLWFVAYFLPIRPEVSLLMALLLDLLLVSPLKAGRAFFFETLTVDADAASWTLLFRYYRCRYLRAVGWRLIVWCLRLLWSALFCLPAMVLLSAGRSLAVEGAAQRDILLSLVLSILGLLLLIAGLAAAEIRLFRYLPVPYLLSRPGGLGEAFSLSRRITSGQSNTLALLYLDYAGWFFACLFILPAAYASTVFQTARAVTVHRFLRQIST